MPKIISAGTADAPYEISQTDIKNFIYDLFSGSKKTEIDRMITVFDNSEIEKRNIAVPSDWLSKDHSLSERSRIFTDTSVNMAKRAIQNCLGKTEIKPAEIDNIIYVTSTGIMTPTLDAVLYNEIGFNRHIKRIPLWGLGCAGGAAAVSRGMDQLIAYPDETALIIAIELCSLTFQKDDLSKSNIIASSLFGDGCACVLLAGKEHQLSKKSGLPELIKSQSTIYDNSLDVMGWDIVDTGFSVVFSRDIPAIVKDKVKMNIDELLKKYNLNIQSISHFIAHPGGLKVINAYEESLGLNSGVLQISRYILKNHGNMSSPSVLYVLNEFLDSGKFHKGEYGIISSLGPGFSSELILFNIN